MITLLVNKAWAQDNESKSNNKNESENDSRDKLHIGFKVGANVSNVYDTQGQDFKADAKFGFAGGGYIAIPIGKYLGIQPELLFSQKGFQGTGVVIGQSYSFTRTTNYIDVPILIAFKPLNSVTILAGPQYSYLIKQKDVFSSSSSNFEVVQEFAHDNIRKNTVCFIGGIDCNYNLFIFGLRSGWDIMNNNGDGTSTSPRYKNVWYQATLGYTLFTD
jgi:hypothetical protein